jgi:hypothetical protein
MLSRKDLFKDTLRKAAHAWKRIVELRLTGTKSPRFQHQPKKYRAILLDKTVSLMFYCVVLLDWQRRKQVC